MQQSVVSQNKTPEGSWKITHLEGAFSLNV